MNDELKVATRDGLQAIAQYERAQKAESENAKLRADLVEMRIKLEIAEQLATERLGMVGDILHRLERNLTGIELRDLVGRVELVKYRAALRSD